MNQPHTKKRIGVLLLNLGTPDAPKAAAIRRWLREFLSDQRVVEIPRIIWLPILYLFILPLRPMRLAAKYKTIWTDSGSPLMAISKAQVARLQESLDRNHPGRYSVIAAMRYGNPATRSALTTLSDADAQELLLLPLYPQYSATTTASSIEHVVRELGEFRNLPALTTVKDYHDHPGYITALANSVRAFRDAHGPGDHLLMSFHGLPQRNAELGDPYPDQCQRTAELLATELGMEDDSWSFSYQSRFGNAKWLEPATDTVLGLLAKETKVIDVICPGFAADCLETLEEINIDGREEFRTAGGADLRYIPALNDSPDHIDMLTRIVLEKTMMTRQESEHAG